MHNSIIEEIKELEKIAGPEKTKLFRQLTCDSVVRNMNDTIQFMVQDQGNSVGNLSDGSYTFDQLYDVIRQISGTDAKVAIESILNK